MNRSALNSLSTEMLDSADVHGVMTLQGGGDTITSSQKWPFMN
jgi:hypothetical protein